MADELTGLKKPYFQVRSNYIWKVLARRSMDVSDSLTEDVLLETCSDGTLLK